jgi:hypothetical protein
MADYAESWRDYRKHRNLLLFAFVAYMPIVGLVGFLTIWAFKPQLRVCSGLLDGVLRRRCHQVPSLQMPAMRQALFLQMISKVVGHKTNSPIGKVWR